MNIVVCSPSRTELQYIYDKLSVMTARSAEESTVFCFDTGEALAEYLSVSPDCPDAAVLSLDLPDADGFSLASALTEQYRELKLALTGRDPGNVERLFQIGTSYFLYTPFTDSSFGSFLTRFNSLLFRGREQYLRLTTKKGITNIAYSDIFYIMSDKRKIIVYQPNGRTDEVYLKLDEAEMRLDDRFVRCHQSYLVNMDYIHGITNEGFTLIDDCFVPISQKKYWDTKKQYVNYIKSKG